MDASHSRVSSLVWFVSVSVCVFLGVPCSLFGACVNVRRSAPGNPSRERLLVFFVLLLLLLLLSFALLCE